MSLSPLFFLLFSWIAVSSASIYLDTADQYSCSFDVDVCGWTIEGPVNHGGPAECDHGWPNHTLHGVTDPGMYMCFYLELLPAHFPGLDRARLTSPTINTTHPVLLSFAVGTVRPPNSTYLNVFLLRDDGTESLLWSTSDLLSPWQSVQLGVEQSGPYKVVIEGISNPPHFPNFGIDEITLTAVECINATTTESYTGVVTTVGSQDNITFPTTSKSSLNPTFKTTGDFYQSTLPKETTKPSDTSKTLSTTSKSSEPEAPTKSAQLGNNDGTGVNPLPIALGTAGGVLVVVIAAFVLWKNYPRKAVVSPETNQQDHDQLP